MFISTSKPSETPQWSELAHLQSSGLPDCSLLYIGDSQILLYGQDRQPEIDVEGQTICRALLRTGGAVFMRRDF
jgi:glutamate racemase